MIFCSFATNYFIIKNLRNPRLIIFSFKTPLLVFFLLPECFFWTLIKYDLL